MSRSTQEQTAETLKNMYFDRDNADFDYASPKPLLARAKAKFIAGLEACLTAMNRVPFIIES
ncbi:hypothetical protein [Paludibacterium yongneupense]|uniref:hypothetical protein n=1 Tax=Paludibacterium yongneupense TaxID=400061 RepID=UPI0003F8F8B3|nr:hypothetical protein [Paludibacterium yongneupense]